MTRAKIKNIIKNTVIGAVGGTLFGMVKIPSDIVLGLTSPVSYPILGGVLGVKNKIGHNTGTSALIGTAIGICMIPMGPVNVALSPLSPVAWGTTGAIVGGVVGVVENDKEDK